MLLSRRVRLASAAALVGAVALGAAPAAAEPPAEPPVTPPPPFELPMDSGTRLVAAQEAARLVIFTTGPVLATTTARRDELQRRWDALTRRLAALTDRSAAAARQIAASQSRLRTAAAEAYVNAGADNAGALRALTDAEEPLQLTRDLHLIEVYGRREVTVYESHVARKEAIDGRIADVRSERDAVRGDLDAASQRVQELTQALADAQRALVDADEGIARFHRLATTASSPIRGPSLLTAQELADFVRASGMQPRITVSIDELAQLYLEEGAKVGVRADVAWAQSILETGWFGFHGSMVEPGDNNYAGIGACDSCTRGFVFPDARTGVRAQMQLLRVYTDAEVERDSLPDPLVLPGTLRLGFRGRVQSWWDLTGTWATASDYGIRVYELYDRMVVASGRR
jgi:hypothetical protein